VHNDIEHHLPLLIEELSSKDSDEAIDTKWRAILTRFFNNVSITLKDNKIDDCQLAEPHLKLMVPAIDTRGHFEITSLDHEKPFTENDCQLANALLTITRQFNSFQHAVEMGAAEERQRIARDLHDDVAARMLTLIHKLEQQKDIDIARSILKSLRNAIYTLDNRSTTTILDAITDIRAEIQERLNTIGMQLIWEQPCQLENMAFTPRQHINLNRVLHELTTNIIRHANAQFMSISVILNENWLNFRTEDNGVGFNMDECIPGKGIHNIQTRIKELNGQVEWNSKSETNNNKGCCVDISFPISTTTD